MIEENRAYDRNIRKHRKRNAGEPRDGKPYEFPAEKRTCPGSEHGYGQSAYNLVSLERHAYERMDKAHKGSHKERRPDAEPRASRAIGN